METLHTTNFSQYVIHADCNDVLESIVNSCRHPVIVTDPPFNIGYHYKTYKDRMLEESYLKMLVKIFSMCPSVVVHYPETLHKLSIEMQKAPTKVVSWVYNSNTRKQHRDIAFYDITPNFTQMTQPYKNPNDKRIKEQISKGKTGATLYDWWNVNQVKNVSKEKTAHPCQMPLEVMKNIVGIIPNKHEVTIIDPFAGSGTTGVACKELGYDFIGVEMDEEYYQICKERLH